MGPRRLGLGMDECARTTTLVRAAPCRPVEVCRRATARLFRGTQEPLSGFPTLWVLGLPHPIPEKEGTE